MNMSLIQNKQDMLLQMKKVEEKIDHHAEKIKKMIENQR